MKILGISKFLTIGCFIMLYPIISFASFGATDIRLDTGNPAGASSSTDPQVCDAANGYIYVIWIDYRDGADKGVYFNRSSDFGATWQPTDTRIDRAAVGVPIVSASLGCTDNGHLYVAWVEGVTGNVAFNTSSDYGASWLASEKVIDSFNSCCAVIISGHGDGHVYVVWENGPGLTPTDVYFNYSSDFGNTWQPSSYRFNSSKGIGSSGSYLSSMISTNDGHVYAAWSDERFQIMPFARDIFFRSASDYGATLSPGDFNIDHGGAPFGTVDSASPELCATQDGHVYVAWRDNRADGFYDIYFNYSND